MESQSTNLPEAISHFLDAIEAISLKLALVILTIVALYRLVADELRKKKRDAKQEVIAERLERIVAYLGNASPIDKDRPS